jgi:hypothetical protein
LINQANKIDDKKVIENIDLAQGGLSAEVLDLTDAWAY